MPVPERLAPVLAVLAVLGAADLARAEDVLAPEERLADIESRLEASREDAALYDQDVAALDARLAELGRQRIAAAAEVQRHEAALTAIERRLATLEDQEARARAALAGQAGTMASVTAALLRVARQPPEALVALPGTADDVRGTGLLLAALVPALEMKAAGLNGELAALEALGRDLADERAKRTVAATELDRRRADVAALMDETAALRHERVEDRDTALAAAAALAAEAEDLRALILRLGATEAEVAAEAGWDGAPPPDAKPDESALAAIAPAAGTAEPLAGDGAGVVAALAPTLRLPAAGTITLGFGAPGADGAPSRGLVVATRADAQVVAPSAGQVAYAGTFKELGQLLILAHGDEYHSVLAGFARIDVVVGQSVTAGEPVGIMGAGAGGDAALYVELRHNGEPVDPLPWLRTAFSEDIEQ